MFTLLKVPTKQELADAWAKNIREIEAEAMERRQAIYDRWEVSSMEAWERDRLMQGVSAWREAQIEAEKVRWYDGLRALERAR